jgi:2-polyprenyl-3-methyl-5-hydroxy-6-metoxy-1,4-benzoquinol methylase
MYAQSSACVICRSLDVEPVLTIYQVPVHCNLLFADQVSAQNTTRGDIALAYCRHCGHLFNAAFQAEKMNYEGEYENSLHFSPRFQVYAETLATDLVERYTLKEKNLIEIGAGKGDFLRLLCQLGDNHGTGFDPSYVADESEPQNGKVRIVRDYYTQDYAHLPVDFLISRHVFEHIANPAEFLSMLRQILAGRLNAVLFLEVPNAAWTIEDLGIWDLIYEHYSYFTRYSLEYALLQARFDVLRVEEKFNRQFLTIEARSREDDFRLMKAGELESFTSLVEKFSQRYHQKFNQWQQTLGLMRSKSERAVIWGAGSKGVTFSNVMDAKDVITHVVDINPRKQGKFAAGSGIAIISPGMLHQVRPDKVIIMNGNYETEIRDYLSSKNIHAEIIIA